jgi:hypothetical protein
MYDEELHEKIKARGLGEIECFAPDCTVRFVPKRKTQKFHDPKCAIRERNRRTCFQPQRRGGVGLKLTAEEIEHIYERRAEQASAPVTHTHNVAITEEPSF